MRIFLDTLALAFGALMVISPASAAKIWGSELLREGTSRQKVLLLRVWRALGILICIGVLLFEAESLVPSSH